MPGARWLVGLLACLAAAWWATPASPARVERPVSAGITPVVQSVVRGGSMTGMVEDGQVIDVVHGYYATHDVERGDVVVYGHTRPLVKSVRGVPGDAFQVTTVEGHHRLLINGEVQTTSRGEPYSLDAASERMISLYARDYQGRIPARAYLILGNTPTGSLDSTRFGLIHQSDLVGKVMR